MSLDNQKSGQTVGVNEQPLSSIDRKNAGKTDSTIEEEGYMGFSQPWSVDWCFSVIGSEYCHTYFWILKDLAWTQGWRLFSISIGSFAIMWWTIILYHALRTRNIDELWNAVGLFLWLFANFWWMTGEAHDFAYPDSPSISDRHNEESARILEVATVWLAVYYFIVVPTLGRITQDQKAIDEYDDGEFKPRFSFFKNFRQYENIHTLFWLCKDLAWNRSNISMWFVFLFPTVLIAIDFLYVAMLGENTIIDLVHFAAGLLWVMGNAVWALGEFFSDSDEPFKLWEFDSKEALTTARWYSSWILIWAFVPVIALYSVWIPLSIMGKIPAPKPSPPPQRRVIVRRKRRSSSSMSTGSEPYQSGDHLSDYTDASSGSIISNGSDGFSSSRYYSSNDAAVEEGMVTESSSLLSRSGAADTF